MTAYILRRLLLAVPTVVVLGGGVLTSRDPFLLARIEAEGHGSLPICIAKTQYSFSTDATLRGAPTGHDLHVREVRLSAGAGFVVLVCGDVMTMPGLPAVPALMSLVSLLFVTTVLESLLLTS